MGNSVIDGDHDHLVRPVVRAAADFPNQPLLAYRSGTGFVDMSCAEVWKRVQELARGLIASGVKAGDRVAVMGKTSVEWLLVDCAINTAGAATVPIYETSSRSQAEWILTDSGAELLVVATDELASMVATVDVPTFDAAAGLLTIESGGLETLVERGEAVSGDELQARLAAIAPEDLATIIYTSGTTGRPKGCPLTHANLRANVSQITDALGASLGPRDTCLLFLPLAHVLTKTAALYCLEHRIRIAFSSSIEHVPEELALAQPSLIAAVPRIFEKVYASAQHAAEADRKGWIFERAAEVAVRWSRQRGEDKISLPTRLEHALYDRLVYAKIRAAFGGQLRMAFSGGGPLGERLTSFFDGTGLRIYEGYGLTETSPILTLSHSAHWSPGAVGIPVRDTEMRLGHDGEVLAKGPQVFSGYWKNPAATAEVFDDDGWFHTGDIGEFDDDGFLHIVGRSKDLIVTAAGKNVAPAPLEDLLTAHSLVSQAMVIGDRRPFVAALITLDTEAVEAWRPHHGEEQLRGEIQQAVDDVNASVSRAESIRKFEILPHDFDLASAELTPTLKVRRSVVLEHYAETIEQIYDRSTS